MVGCQGGALSSDAGGGLDAAVPPASDGGSVVYDYCNRTNPENQTKFVHIELGVPQDGGPACVINYDISFGSETFSCTCEPMVCDAAYARLRAAAAACTSVDAGG